MKRLEMLQNGVNTAMPVVQSGMSINISNIRLQATKAIAKSINMTLSDMLRNMTLSDMLSSKANTGKSVVRNIRA
ncbi:MAG: hypothetical protein ACR5LF_11575 [Symbiopectobacterium sp.]